MTQRKLVHGFLAALLVMMQLLTLLQIRSVHAVEQPSVTQKLVDNQDLSLDVVGVQNDDVIDWTVNYERPITAADRALKLDVKAGDTTISPRDPTNWQQLQAVDPQWWQESEFSTQAKGSLHYQTSIDQSSLTITAQLDEQTTTQVEAVTPVSETDEAAPPADPVEQTPETTVTSDLLDPETAGPHTVTLEIPETEVDEPVPDPDDEQAQAEATEESVVTPELKDEGEESPAITAAADDVQGKASVGNLIEPDKTNTILATNLVLTTDALANVALKVTNKAGAEVNTGTIYQKRVTPGTNNYDTVTRMQTITSKNYMANSQSVAVIFNQYYNAQNAKLELSYDNVGYAQLQNGTIAKIGARVSIGEMIYRNSDWQNGTDNNKMGMDFATNFYSGMQLANVRMFDWEVTFFDVSSKQAINFIKDSDAMLTFTSLNPGEFVKPPSGLTFTTSDPDSIKETDLGALEVPNSATGLQDWIAKNWANNTQAVIEDAYTSHKWGDWELKDPIKPETTWADKLGEPTFGNGAAAFGLDGVTFKFKRGTYFGGNTTWLANASGLPTYKLPRDLAVNKSISANAHDGGGTMADASKPAPFTPNDLDEHNINPQALDKAEMYYYVNVQTYSLGGELLAYPHSITITDPLPAGMSFATGNVSDDIVIFNERSDDPAKPKTLSTAKTTIDGQVLTVHLDANEVKKIPFQRGYLTVRIKVKTDHDPNLITQQHIMKNQATATILGPDDADSVTKSTNTVTVDVTPTTVDAAFKKVDHNDAGIQGVQFQLFDNAQATGTALYTATSTADGTVNFTKVRLGTYWLKETSTPTGYLPLTTPIKVTIQADGTIKWPTDWKTGNKVVNQQKPWTIELEKTDDHQKRLSGAEFTLTTADGTEIAKGTTDGKSALTLDSDKLLPGDYELTETKAPTGFEKLTGKFTFTLKLDGTVEDFDYTGDDLKDGQYKFDATNHLLKLNVENNAEDIPLPVTGGNGIQALIAAAVVIMLMALMLGWHWRKEVTR